MVMDDRKGLLNDATAPDPTGCPLCGGPNNCAMAAGGAGPCWCATATIPSETLARIPDEARNRACICPRCASAERISIEGILKSEV